MMALIDGDLVAYINAATAENDPKEIAILRTDKFVRDILEKTNADSYRIFLSGSDNFRYKINPEYKANRKDTPDPKWREACKEFLVTEWKAEVTEGYEADDALGINQSLMYPEPGNEQTIICSIDKDLDMIPGMHYSWPIIRLGKEVRPGKIYEVSEIEGLRSFFRSLLVGDRSDNIIGINGIGKVKASKLIDHLEDENEMSRIVYELYDNHERFEMNAKCLWIMREEGDIWQLMKEDFLLESPLQQE